MFLEFFSHLLALDIAWIIQLILSNLLWVFAFSVMIYFFLEGKKFFIGFLVLTFNVWLWIDFQILSGWFWLIGIFLMVHYIGKFAVITFAEADPELKKRLIVINEVQGIGTLVVFNLIVGGMA